MIPGRTLLRVLGAALLFFAVSCDSPPLTPPPTPVDGSVAGTVQVEGVGLQGLPVSLTGAVDRTAVTDASGRFRFEALGEGGYTVTVSGLPTDAAFPASADTFEISRAQPTATVSFSGNWMRDVSITVSARIEGAGLPGASVSLQGPAAATGTTDATGTATFSGLRRGTWEVELGGFDPALHDFPTRITSVVADGPDLREVLFEGIALPQSPVLPGGLAATVSGAEAIDLVWVDLSDDEDRFDIERRSPAGIWNALQSVPAGTAAFTDSGLEAATTYVYRVRACNVIGCSEPSNEAMATTDDVPPGPPTDLVASSTGPTSGRLTWIDASSNESNFEVERRVVAAGSAPEGATGTWTSTTSTAPNATVHDDLGLTPATTYDYRVRACNEVGCSSFTAGATLTTDDVPPSQPLAPATVTTGATSLRVTWTDGSDNEAAFEVERREGAAGAWSAAGEAPANADQWDDTGLLPTTLYAYRVRACNGVGCSAWTAEATGTTNDLPPLVPTALSASANGEEAIDVTWVDASTNETGFEVEVGPDGASWSALVSLPAGSTTHTDTGLAAGSTRHYRVRACNADGCSDWSSSASATTDLSAPSSPTTLAATADGQTQIDLTWNDTSNNESSFSVQKSPDGSSWAALAAMSGGSESYSDTGLSGGDTWFYRVRACNVAGCSSWSNTADATTDTPPPSGSNLSIGGVYINQRIQRLAGDVPLVADLDGYLRVFVLANEANAFTPDVRVDFYVGGALTHTETLSAPSGSVPQSLDEGSLNSSWNVLVPGSLIQPGLEIEVLVDPSNSISESVESDNAYPGGGARAALDVRDTPTFDVTFVPVRQTVNGTVGDVNAGNASNFLDEAMAMLPFADADVEIRSEYSTDLPAVEAGDGSTWSGVLSELNALRSLEGSSRFYYGVLEVTYGGGIAGIGYIGWPVSLGWDKSGSAGGIAAHEWGHNLGRRHSPGCGAGNADASYPHADGSIGHWGLHVPTLALRSPSTYRDLMTYCGPEWISDYVFESMIDRVAPATSVGPAPYVSGERLRGSQSEPGLLVWGRIEGGDLILEPALDVDAPPTLPSGGGYRIEGRTSAGGSLFSYSFDPIPVADANGDEGHFAFVVPLRSFDRAALNDVRLSNIGATAQAVRTATVGPARALGVESSEVSRVGAREAEITWNPAEYPLVIVRDADTGEILTLGRSGQVRVSPVSDRIELELSNGLETVERVVRVWR